MKRIEQRLFDMALRATLGSVYTLDYARSVKSALPLLEIKTFDLIFLDDQLSNLENAGSISTTTATIYEWGLYCRGIKIHKFRVYEKQKYFRRCGHRQ